jgi:crossover junction endodeoxyribonuclease RusA
MLTMEKVQEYFDYPVPEQLVASYVFHPPDRRKRDIDNFLAMMKNYQDGVCAALGIDDSRIKRTVIEWGDVCKGGKVVLTLTELEYEGEGLA